MSFIDQLKKYFTGSTTPTNERLKEAVIVAVVILVVVLVGYYYLKNKDISLIEFIKNLFRFRS